MNNPEKKPPNSHQSPNNNSNSWAYTIGEIEFDSYTLIRLVGYILLALAAIDYIFILIPPRFLNPVWEFETIGAMVDHVVTPLLGMLFIFYRVQNYVGGNEKKIVCFLSWSALVIGLLYLLMLPLGVIDTTRISQQNKAMLTLQASAQTEHLQEIKGKLQAATTDEQINNLIASLAQEKNLPPIGNTQAVKNQFLAKLSQAEQNIRTQSENVEASQTKALIRNSVKWNLGAVICGTAFILIWRVTEWARSPYL